MYNLFSIDKSKRLSAALGSFFELSRDLLCIVRRDGALMRVNRAFETILGYKSADLEGRAFSEFLHVDDAGSSFHAISQLLEGDDVTNVVNRVRSANGEYRHIEWNASTSGDMIFAVGRDVTSHLQNEIDLMWAQKSADAANKVKSQFIANMSHEIRTPMNGVMGAMEILSRTNLNSRQEKFVEIARQSAKQLLDLINDVLDLSKIEAGRLDLEIKDFDLHDAIFDAVELFAENASAKKLELLACVSPGVPRKVSGDPTRLRQVLVNLIGNAVKFTDRGEVSVRAAALEAKGSELTIKIEVRDTGIGIDTQAIGGLFKPFSQADASTTRKYGGTGLGLCIVKQIVEKMGGGIGVVSTPGQGSTFWIQVKLALSKDADGSQQRSTDSSLSGLRVLVVSNHSETLEMARCYLSSWHMQPVAVSSDGEAVAAIRASQRDNKPFDIAITDWALGEDAVLTLARTIKSHPGCKRTIQILLAPLGMSDSSHAEAIKAGFTGFVGKPVRPGRLWEVMAALVAADSGLPRLVPPAVASSETAGNNRNLKVLLAEDNLVNAEIAKVFLSGLGYQIEHVRDGREALSAYENRRFDIILMDCQMPLMDGFAVARAIRKYEKERQWPHTPILALTANVYEKDRQECLAAGMDGFLSKPISVAQLSAALAHALSGNVEKAVAVPAPKAATA